MDSSIVYVDKGYLINSKKKKFQVRLVDYHPKFADDEETMGIVIKSPITSQTYKVLFIL